MIGDPELLAAVDAQRDAVLATVRFVHAHPELAHAEHACSAYLCDVLERAGLEVERGLAGLETAFRATLRGARPGRTVGVVCVYDAVAAVRPDGSLEAVHSCGHGPVAGGAVGAALALARRRDGLAGTLQVLGCPADEIHAPGTVARGGGKRLTAEAGVWDGVDAALYVHPEFVDTVTLRSLALRRDRALVAGRRSLQAELGQPPRRALRTLAALDRQGVVLERLVLDGDVEEATGLVLDATLLLFGDDEDGIAEHAAVLREALPEAEWTEAPVVVGVRPDAEVTAAVREAFLALGRPFVDDPPPLPFATDFGNISRRCPAALVGVGRDGGWAFHSDEGAAEFAGPDGDEAALAIARVLALAAARLTEPR